MDNNQPQDRTLSCALDAACLYFILFLAFLAWIFPQQIPQATKLFLQLFCVGIAYLCAEWLRRRTTSGVLSSMLRATEILALFSFLFQAIAGYQHLLHDAWMDDRLIAFENSLFGIETTLFFQNLVTPILTEAMMFAYVIYVPLLLIVPLVCYRSGGSRATDEYLLQLVLAYVVCYVGFILFPVASPLFYVPQLYTVPLEGGFFTWCGEWIRATQHYAGGSLPSPHCAAGTVMLAALYRTNRAWYYVVLPTMLLLYASTVYGRYHYTADAVAGIVTGLAVVKYSPFVVNLVQSVINRIKPYMETVETESKRRPAMESTGKEYS